MEKSFVSLVLPAYNEEKLIQHNLRILYDYMQRLNNKYRWEILIVNDGSSDRTGELAETFKEGKENVFVLHHKVNRNLGHALRTGFCAAKGDYVVVLDLDLSYSPDHIERLVDEIIKTDADIVVASPYMRGGKVSNVPYLRKIMSRFVNRFLYHTAQDKIYTFTGMVRAYKKSFLDNLNLKARDYEINPEIIYKAMLLRARIVEIPAHLSWIKVEGEERKSNIHIFRGVLSGLMSGFIFRPYMFFIITGVIILLIALYVITWIIINTFNIYGEIIVSNHYFDDKFSAALAQVFQQRPHAFFIGGLALVVALQFLSLGFLSLQSKRYFEELFYLGTSILKKTNKK